jgi:ADP-heptose:LPS heptosyltransferase
MLGKNAIVSFFNGLGDTVLLLPVLRCITNAYENVLIIAHNNSRPLLIEFKNVYFIENYKTIPEIDSAIFNQFRAYPDQLSYYDFNITYNPIKDWLKATFKPIVVLDYQRVQKSDRKDIYESCNMFHKNFIQADMWPLPLSVDRKPVIPEHSWGGLDKFSGLSKKIITIHTDTDSSKEWSVFSWYTLISCVKANFSDYEIILLGFPNARLKKLEVTVAPDFYSCLEAVRKSDFFIGIDSVFAHVADSFGVNGLVLFGNTKYTDWIPSSPSVSYIVGENNNVRSITVRKVLDEISLCLNTEESSEELLRRMYVRDYRLIESATEDILNDISIIKKILNTCPFIYPYISNSLKRNQEIIKLAVSGFWYMISFVPEDCRTDEICIEAIKQNGWALDFVNEKLKNKKDIVEMAVINKGDALEFAPTHFRSDREIVHSAVKENGLAIQYADSMLFEDDEILENALTNNPYAIEFIPSALHNYSKWKGLCEKINPDVAILINKLNDYVI